VIAGNYACFLSGNEDGGAYFPPEPDIKVERGKLIISYAHGRYGWWQYVFRYRNGNFELIGHDVRSNRGPVTLSTGSINFLSVRMEVLTNVGEDEEDEQLKTVWKSIKVGHTFETDRNIRFRQH
jgi:hypothetical protein